MKANTKYFGEVEIDDDKVLTFKEGLIGFEEFTKYAIVHDAEEETPVIKWIQSLEEPTLALPVIDPLMIMTDYNPMVSEEIANQLFGDSEDEEVLLFVTLVVPSELENMTANLKAPIIINPTTKVAHQVIVENAEYEMKYKIYELLKSAKEKAGE